MKQKTNENYATCSIDYFHGCCAIDVIGYFYPIEYNSGDESIKDILKSMDDSYDGPASYILTSVIKKGYDGNHSDTDWKLVRKELVSLGFKSLATFVTQGSGNTIEILGLDKSKMSKPKSKKKK